MQMIELQGGENMFCPECGNPLNDDQRFCPKCGTPVEGVEQPADAAGGAESAGQPVNAAGGAESAGQPVNAGGGAEYAGQSADTGDTGAGNAQSTGNTAGSSYGRQAASAGSSAGNTGGAKNGNLDMVMRGACAVFAVFFLISALTRIPGILGTLFQLRIVYFISASLGFGAALVMALTTAASAWKWNSRLKDLIFGGAVLGVLFRLLSLIIMLVANLVTYGGAFRTDVRNGLCACYGRNKGRTSE